MNLAGQWHFSTEDDALFAQPDFDHSGWNTMAIPSNWFLAGLDHQGVVWFRRVFRYRLPRENISLHFDGVDYFADVFLNGVLLGHHTGYFDPFEFDVTKTIRSGKNLLAVRVESPYELPGLNGWYMRKRLIKGVFNHHDCRPGGGWEPIGQSYNTGGIWNRVHLEEHGTVTIEHLLLHADLNAQPTTLLAEVRVRNRSQKKSAQLELRCIPENFRGKSQTAKFSMEIPEGESVQSVQMSVNNVQPWQPWDRGFPYLYQIKISLSAGKEIVSGSGTFGFRTVRVEPGFQWFVNEKPYFLRGSNYLPSQWLSETLFKKVACAKDHPFGSGGGGDFFPRDIDLAKQANLNILRVHAHVLPPEFHEACDRAGMLVWQDFPFQWGYSDDPEFHEEAVRQMKAMVIGLYNHPSIITWCCHNESPCDAAWMAVRSGEQYNPDHNRDLDARLETVAHTLDPTRYVHRNSGTGDGHTYPGWYVGHWRDYKNLPSSPLVTEYGAQGLPDAQSVRRMLLKFEPDAGYSELVQFKRWLDSLKKISAFKRSIINIGTNFWNLTEKKHWKSIQDWMKGWGIKVERSVYNNLPSVEETPKELKHAREIWDTWRFHDFQPAETFDNGIDLGGSLEEFVSNSQRYQSLLIQYATECYRRAKYTNVTGIIQFDFCDPWPAVTWSVLDYWRTPKPAYDALRRSMQPVLPSFTLPEKMEPGNAIQVSFCVVNDLLQASPSAVCNWRLEGGMGDIASATFPVNIPADNVSSQTKITLPSLGTGVYKLSVGVSANGKNIGENWYELNIN
ncbi:MAG: sugar-binding domain-containing protein [Anaerolineales bacterium]